MLATLKKSKRSKFTWGGISILSALVLMLFIGTAQATPIPGDLDISAELVLDDSYTGVFGSATGNLTSPLVIGGTSSLIGWPPLSTPSPSSVTTASWTDIGDGVGASADFNASTDFDEFFLGIDMFIGMTNTSATDDYRVTFGVDFSSHVDTFSPVTEVEFPSAYALNDFSLVDADTVEEHFASFLVSDTAFGNEDTDGPIAGFGGSLDDAGFTTFDILIGAGESINLEGWLTMDGGLYAEFGFAESFFDVFVSIDGVENVTPPGPGPDPIPEPATMLLFGTGLAGLFASRRRKA